MGDYGFLTRRAVMFGAIAMAATMAGNTPVGAAYVVDTTGDGIADAMEFVEEKAHSIAGAMTTKHGGEWKVSVTDDCVMIFKNLNVYTG